MSRVITTGVPQVLFGNSIVENINGVE
jgi:hypothetical protein